MCVEIDGGGKFININLGEGVKALKAVATRGKKPCAALLIVEVDGRKEIWSAGKNAMGLLGQGEEVKKSETF